MLFLVERICLPSSPERVGTPSLLSNEATAWFGVIGVRSTKQPGWACTACQKWQRAGMRDCQSTGSLPASLVAMRVFFARRSMSTVAAAGLVEAQRACLSLLQV